MEQATDPLSSTLEQLFKTNDKLAFLSRVSESDLYRMIDKLRSPPFLSKISTKERQKYIQESIFAILSTLERLSVSRVGRDNPLIIGLERVLGFRDLAHICDNTSEFYRNLILGLRKYLHHLPHIRNLEHIYDVAKLYVNVGVELGRGTFGRVFKGFRISDGLVVAIKVMDWKLLQKNNKLMEILQCEIATTSHLDHPNVVRLLDHQSHTEYFFLILEFCDAGTLKDFIQTQSYNQKTAWEFMKGLAGGLQYLKEKKIIHRDLKADNILLAKQKDGKLIAKIADFSFAKFLGPEELTHTICGTKVYMAPEILDRQSYTDKCDLWSVGCIMHEIAYRRPPYPANNEKELREKIQKNELFLTDDMINQGGQPLSPEYLKHFKALIKDLLVRIPVLRLGWVEFFTHPYFITPPELTTTTKQTIKITTPTVATNFTFRKEFDEKITNLQRRIEDLKAQADEKEKTWKEQKMKMEQTHSEELQKLKAEKEFAEDQMKKLEHELRLQLSKGSAQQEDEKERERKREREQLLQEIEEMRKLKEKAEREAQQSRQESENFYSMYKLARDECVSHLNELSDLKLKLHNNLS